MPLLLALLLTSAAADLSVQPYLQLATPTTIRVGWEAPGSEPGTVRYGDGLTATSTVVWTDGATSIHEVELTGLVPGALVTYQVSSGGADSDSFTLRTPPDDPSARTWRFVAVSDVQRAAEDPLKWGEVAKEGVLKWAEATYGAPVADALDGVLVPGDLVENGQEHTDWTHDFFGLQHPLFAQVPLYAVIGNHEADADWYWRYIQAPRDNQVAPEHWWSHKLGNVLIIGLDSNFPYAAQPQLDWLDNRLATACEEDDVDFVFAELHHPAQSEAWVAGNNPWSYFVQGRLEQFTLACDRPSVMFFGHTHAYSRGQSQEARHLMINVATGGGAVDRWGAEYQRDEAPYSITDDAWGWVLVESEPGENAALHLRRFSRGNRDGLLDNVLIDELTLHRHAPVPAPPVPAAAVGDVPLSADCALLRVDVPDPADVQAAQWQVATDCERFYQPTVDAWVQDHNLYFGTDTLAGHDPLETLIPGPLMGDSFCWRARVRSQELQWSDWSAATLVPLTAATRSADLLADEVEGDPDWTEGAVLGDEACGSPTPIDGAFVLALGAPCSAPGAGTLSRTFQLAQDAPGDTLRLTFAAWATSTLRVTLSSHAVDGELHTATLDLPASDGWQRGELELTVAAGDTLGELTFTSDAPAFVDDTQATLGASGPPDCALRPAPVVEKAPTDEGCGCQHSAPSAWAWLLALGAAWRRQRAR